MKKGGCQQDIGKGSEMKQQDVKKILKDRSYFYELFWLFMFGGVLGCAVETVWCYFALGSFMSRSSDIFFPVSIVWGSACVLYAVILHKRQDTRKWVIFLKCMIAGGLFEYFCGWVCEILFGFKFWNYSHIPFNLKGRINLPFCLLWGIAGVVLEGIYPPLAENIKKRDSPSMRRLTIAFMVYMVLTMSVSSFALLRMEKRNQRQGAANKFEILLDHYFSDSVMKTVYPKIEPADY